MKKTVATGSIVPRREVEVKPKVTGVLAELYVEPGKKVKAGDPLGKISIIPDAMQINQAEAGVRTAQIAFDNAKRELAAQRGAATSRASSPMPSCSSTAPSSRCASRS